MTDRMDILGDRYSLIEKNLLCEKIINSDAPLDTIFKYGIVVQDTKDILIREGDDEYHIIMYLCKFKDKHNITKQTLLPKCLIDVFFEKTL